MDALREPIDSCWNQEPDERPTSLEVLRALLALEIQRQGPIVSVEDPDEIGGGSISRMTPKKVGPWLATVTCGLLSIEHFTNSPRTIESPEID